MITIDITHEQYTTLRMALRDVIADYEHYAKAFSLNDPNDAYAAYMEVLATQCKEILREVERADEVTTPAPAYGDDFSNEGLCVDDDPFQEVIPC